jgi:hypothetical protein
MNHRSPTKRAPRSSAASEPAAGLQVATEEAGEAPRSSAACEPAAGPQVAPAAEEAGEAPAAGPQVAAAGSEVASAEEVPVSAHGYQSI